MSVNDPTHTSPSRTPWLTALHRWFDTTVDDEPAAASDERVDWMRVLPFAALHLSCIAVLWVGVSWTAVCVALTLYVVRMFAITGFYHRYFAHRAFRTSRVIQLIFAVVGASAVQRGPLWWAAHHRHHHKYADTGRDPHSPRRGFWWSHMGWFLSRSGFRPDMRAVSDLQRYPELCWLDRYDVAVPAALAMGLYALGAWLARVAPQLHTDGEQLLVWGFCISTVLLFHITVTINSIAHRFGRRRYDTRDDSRNSWLLALLTFGEGWHNNHHFFPGSARQGFRWWEIDVTYYGLRALALLGIIRDLRPVPAGLRRMGRS